jgi:hypothetical protein
MVVDEVQEGRKGERKEIRFTHSDKELVDF